MFVGIIVITAFIRRWAGEGGTMFMIDVLGSRLVNSESFRKSGIN